MEELVELVAYVALVVAQVVAQAVAQAVALGRRAASRDSAPVPAEAAL